MRGKDRFGELLCLRRAHVQHMEREPLGAFVPDPGHPLELFNESCQRGNLVTGHQNGRFRPLLNAPIACSIASSALRIASFVAAISRSASISISSGSTTSGCS